MTGSEVHVDIFDDRLEITSPGGMPGERSLEDFDIRSMPSIRRNPLLADMCERLKIMERRGSGVKKIFEDYTKNFKNPGARMPKLESFPTYFRTTLPNLINGYNDEQLVSVVHAVSPVATPVATPVMTPVVPPVMPPVMPPVEKPSETLIDAVQRKVLAVLKAGGVMSTSELAGKVGISQSKNMRRRYLRLLLDMGLVEYTIPHKPNSRLQKYRLTEKGCALSESENGE
mgnify:FL=1